MESTLLKKFLGVQVPNLSLALYYSDFGKEKKGGKKKRTAGIQNMILKFC